MGSQGKWVVLGLLGVAVVLAAGKALPAGLRAIRRPATNACGD
jgi:hypothetical protein